MPKLKKTGMLRIRMDRRFEKELDSYINDVNSKSTNVIDRSRLVREAVAEFIANKKSIAA